MLHIGTGRQLVPGVLVPRCGLLNVRTSVQPGTSLASGFTCQYSLGRCSQCLSSYSIGTRAGRVHARPTLPPPFTSSAAPALGPSATAPQAAFGLSHAVPIPSACDFLPKSVLSFGDADGMPSLPRRFCNLPDLKNALFCIITFTIISNSLAQLQTFYSLPSPSRIFTP